MSISLFLEPSYRYPPVSHLYFSVSPFVSSDRHLIILLDRDKRIHTKRFPSFALSFIQTKFILDGRYKLCSKKSASLRRILQWTVLFYTLFCSVSHVFVYRARYHHSLSSGITTTNCLIINQRETVF